MRGWFLWLSLFHCASFCLSVLPLKYCNTCIWTASGSPDFLSISSISGIKLGREGACFIHLANSSSTVIIAILLYFNLNINCSIFLVPQQAIIFLSWELYSPSSIQRGRAVQWWRKDGWSTILVETIWSVTLILLILT